MRCKPPALWRSLEHPLLSPSLSSPSSSPIAWAPAPEEDERSIQKAGGDGFSSGLNGVGLGAAGAGGLGTEGQRRDRGMSVGKWKALGPVSGRARCSLSGRQRCSRTLVPGRPWTEVPSSSEEVGMHRKQSPKAHRGACVWPRCRQEWALRPLRCNHVIQAKAKCMEKC